MALLKWPRTRKLKPITQRAALERIERMTRGYYWLSAQGMMHTLAAHALRMPLTDDERRMLRAEQDTKR